MDEAKYYPYGPYIYMTLAGIATKFGEGTMQECSGVVVMYIQLLLFGEMWCRIGMGGRAMLNVGAGIRTSLVLASGFLISVVQEADPTNVAVNLHLLASGLALATYIPVIRGHWELVDTMMWQQVLITLYGLFWTVSPAWPVEDVLRKSILRFFAAVIPLSMSYCTEDVQVTVPRLVGPVLNGSMVIWDILSALVGMWRRELSQVVPQTIGQALLKRTDKTISRGTTITLWVVGFSSGIFLALLTWYFPSPRVFRDHVQQCFLDPLANWMWPVNLENATQTDMLVMQNTEGNHPEGTTQTMSSVAQSAEEDPSSGAAQESVFGPNTDERLSPVNAMVPQAKFMSSTSARQQSGQHTAKVSQDVPDALQSDKVVVTKHSDDAPTAGVFGGHSRNFDEVSDELLGHSGLGENHNGHVASGSKDDHINPPGASDAVGTTG